MKLSTKTRYGISAMVVLTSYYETDDYIALIKLAEELNISKIYLEQIFYLLKQSNLVLSTKGSKGGYRLANSPASITMYDIMYATNCSIFENDDKDEENYIFKAINNIVILPVHESLEKELRNITLLNVYEEVQKNRFDDSFMYYL